MLIRSRRAVMGLSTLGVGAMLLLSGCDFWPPALQAQIEQLHSSADLAASILHTIAAARERAVKATKSSAAKPVAKSAVKKSVKPTHKPAAKSSVRSHSTKKIKPAPVR